MLHPFPAQPRGPRRRHCAPPELFLACPRVSPEWELDTVHALMKPKPHTKAAVEHRDGQQPWSPSVTKTTQKLIEALNLKTNTELTIHHPPAGEYHLIARLPAATPGLRDQAKAVAVAMSTAVPNRWFVLGRLFLLNGRFHRRRFGYRLDLVPATNVHLTRPMRQLVRSLNDFQRSNPNDQRPDDS